MNLHTYAYVCTASDPWLANGSAVNEKSGNVVLPLTVVAIVFVICLSVVSFVAAHSLIGRFQYLSGNNIFYEKPGWYSGK